MRTSETVKAAVAVRRQRTVLGVVKSTMQPLEGDVSEMAVRLSCYKDGQDQSRVSAVSTVASRPKTSTPSATDV